MREAKIELGYKFLQNLLLINLAGFDVVLGIDWLIANYAWVLYDLGSVEIHTLTRELVIITRDKPQKLLKLTSVMKLASSLQKPGIVYMVSIVVDTKR